MAGHGGWSSQELQSDAFPLRGVLEDPDPKTGYGWFFAKSTDDVTDLWFRDDDPDHDPIQVTKAGGILASAVDRDYTSKAVDATLTADEVAFGFVRVTVTGKTMTLPTPAAGLAGSDVVIGPSGAFFTTVTIQGGGSFGGGGTTSQKVNKGTTSQFFCDGSTWFMGGGGAAEALAITDLTDVSAITGAGSTVVFSDGPTLISPIVATIAGDASSPIDGQIWYNGTLERFRGQENSFTFSVAAETITPAHLMTGANVSAQIMAAIAFAGDGGTIDLRAYSGGTIGTTVVVDKKVKFLGDGTFTVTANPGFWFQHGASAEPDPGSGAGEMEGSGNSGLIFNCATGITCVKMQADYAALRNFAIIYASDDAANVGIECSPDPASPHGLLHPQIENVAILGGGVLGTGVTISETYGGTYRLGRVIGFNHGLRVEDDGALSSTTWTIDDVRFHNNNEGVRFENGLDFKVINCTIEGNYTYNVHIVDGQGLFFDHNYYENLGPDNVFIDRAPDDFPRHYFFTNEGFFDAPGPIGIHLADDSRATQTVHVTGGSGNPGHKSIGDGLIICDGYQKLNDAHVGNVIDMGFWAGFPNRIEMIGIPGYIYNFRGWDQVSLSDNFVWQPTTAAAFYLRPSTDTFLFTADWTTATVAIGTANQAHIKFLVYNTESPTANLFNPTERIYSTFDPTGDTTAFNMGLSVSSSSAIANIHNFSTLVGGGFETYHQGVGTVAYENPLSSTLWNVGGGVITVGSGFDVIVRETTGSTAGSLFGERILAPALSGGSTINTYTALQIGYAPSGITNFYSLEVLGGQVFFNDSLSANSDFYIFAVGDVSPANVSFRMDSASGHLKLGGDGSTPPAKLSVTKYAQTGGTPRALYVTSGNHSAMDASTEVIQAHFDWNHGYEWSTGALAEQRFTYFAPPTVAFVGDSVATNVATVAIGGAPSAGAHATLTNPWALWVQDGFSLFNDGIAISFHGPAAPGDNTSQVRLGNEDVIAWMLSNDGGIGANIYADSNDNLVLVPGFIATNRYVQIGGGYGLLTVDGTESNPGVVFTSDPDTGIRWGGSANVMMFVTGGADRWEIDASGHLLAVDDAQYSIGALGATRPLNLFLAGYVLAQELVTADADGRTINANESGTLFTNEGASSEDTFTLPAAAANLWFAFYVQDADGLKIVAGTGDTIRLAGSASATAGYIRSSSVGSFVRLHAVNATEWVGEVGAGTWTVDV